MQLNHYLGCLLLLSWFPKFSSEVKLRHFSGPDSGLPSLASPANPHLAYTFHYQFVHDHVEFGRSKIKEFYEDLPVTFVMGNEAADLDSIVTAIVLALYLQHVELTQRIYVPVVNIAREDLHLRKDAAFLLEYAGMPVQSLLFIDEIDLETAMEKNQNMQIVLTDHNHLADSQGFLKDRVVGVFDHHSNDGDFDPKHMHFFEIEPVGSCASLIALHIKESASFDASILDILSPNIATLLMSVILLDTVNFNPQEKKSTDTDFLAYMWLYSFHPVSHESLYRTLNDLRGDTQGLSTFDLFRKDLKFRNSAGTKYAFSSVSGIALQEWLAADMELFEHMGTFAKQMNVSLFCLLTKGIAKESFANIMRDLVCLSSDGELMDTISDSLAGSGFVQQNLNIQELENTSPNLLVRLNDSSSRKRLSPLIHEAVIESLSRKDTKLRKDSEYI